MAAAYDRGNAALKEGDWAKFGAEQKRIKELLDKLRTIK